MYIFEVKNLIFRHFSNIWNFNNPCDVMKSKVSQKGAKFVCYILTVIKISSSISMFFESKITDQVFMERVLVGALTSIHFNVFLKKV